MTVLTFIVLLPILNAVLIMCGAPARKSALLAAWTQLVLTLFALFGYNRGLGGYQFGTMWNVAPDWDLKLMLGVDGLSLVMLLLTGLVTVAAVYATPKIEKRENLFYACVLLISGGAAGAFASLDLFFFYAFHELALIPTFLLIGIWGHGERQVAAWKITIYLAIGSMILLVGLAKLYLAQDVSKLADGQRTFDMVKMLNTPGLIPAAAQGSIYGWLLIGFGILISLVPFHSWAPTAYASAPTPVAMLHAGVLKKFGLYGLIRLAVPLLPDGAREWVHVLLILLVANILYIGFVTIAQKRLDLMLGYSSVMHMGYIFLGIAAANAAGVTGASLLMLAHGLSIAALFAMCGYLRQSAPSLTFTSLGGLAKRAPFLGYAFGMAAFASIGLPGFANFASELMVFFGAFGSGAKPGSLNFGPQQIATICALWGVVISAVYMLRAYRQMFQGEPQANTEGFQDPGCCVKWPVILLLAALMIGGLWPKSYLNFIQPSVESLVDAPLKPEKIAGK
jgi:NADH-quinone oxidoreductase subunit M